MFGVCVWCVVGEGEQARRDGGSYVCNRWWALMWPWTNGKKRKVMVDQVIGIPKLSSQ